MKEAGNRMTFLSTEDMTMLTTISARLAGAEDAAPRRNRLTKTLGGGACAVKLDDGRLAPITWVAIVPVDGPFYAVRLGFAALHSYEWEIQSAAIYPSETYGPAPQLPVANRLPVIPVVNGKRPPGAKVFFDNKGRDLESINIAGQQRSFRFPGNSENPQDLAAPFSIVWSDFVPCEFVPRADGGPGHLLFIYITIAGDVFTGTGSSFLTLADDAAANRGRPIFTARADQRQNDFADCPEGTGWNLFPSAPLFCVQYLSRRPGIQIVQTGDSLSVGPHAFSNSLTRSAYDLSSKSLPIEVANFAWGAENSQVYLPFTNINADAIQPSIFVPQPCSRNDGYGVTTLTELLAENLRLADRLMARWGSRLLINGGGQVPSWDNNPEAILGYTTLREFLNALPASYGIPVFDCAAILGRPEAPWLFIDDVSDDATHSNSMGEELLVPLVRSALQKTIGTLPS